MRVKNEANAPQQYWYVHTPKNVDYMRGEAVVMVVNSERGDPLCADLTAARTESCNWTLRLNQSRLKKTSCIIKDLNYMPLMLHIKYIHIITRLIEFKH